jgi:uncharacterized protein
MRPLDVLLTPAEQRLMRAVLLHPDRDFGTVELLDRMGASRSAGSTLLRRWVDCGLLRERRVGNQRRLAANPAFLLYPELRRMIVKTVGVAQPLAHAMRPLAPRLQDAFVFGSVAAGTDGSESDVDLAVVGDLTLFDISPLLDAAQAELGRPVHVNLYTAAEWGRDDDPVLAAVRKSPRIDLMEALHAEAD